MMLTRMVLSYIPFDSPAASNTSGIVLTAIVLDPSRFDSDTPSAVEISNLAVSEPAHNNIYIHVHVQILHTSPAISKGISIL